MNKWSLSIEEEERAKKRERIALIVFLPSSLFVSLPHGATGWSVVVRFPGHTHLFLIKKPKLSQTIINLMLLKLLTLPPDI